MNILVCLKILPNPEKILFEDYQQFDKNIDLSYAGLEINCFDTSGLEIGLKLKDEMAVQGVKASCTAFTIGSKFPNMFSENLYSIGYDNVVLRKNSPLEYQPKNVAKLIVEYAKEIKADYVIMGGEAGQAETGMVPFYVANLMKMPIINNVEKCSYSNNDLIVDYRDNNSLLRSEIKDKCVIIVGNSPEVLRVSSLRQRLRFRGRKASILPDKDNFCGDNDKKVFKIPDNSRHCKMLDLEKDEHVNILKSLLNTKEIKKATKDKNCVYSRYKNDIKLYTGNNILFNDLISKIKEDNPKLILLEDNRYNRKLSIGLADNFGVDVIFGASLDSIDNNNVYVNKYVMGSNLIWKKPMKLGSILLVKRSEIPDDIDSTNIGSEESTDSFLNTKVLESSNSSKIENSEVIVVCGNGMKTKDNAFKTRTLAKKLDAGFGLTRPSALNAWGSPSEIIGQSGYILSPSTTLALGVAGAAAFMVGVDNSQTIIAVNTDKEALIFKQADYGIVMDAAAFVDKMLELL